jgi:hypothetical protein
MLAVVVGQARLQQHIMQDLQQHIMQDLQQHIMQDLQQHIMQDLRPHTQIVITTAQLIQAA